jgi:hypothetical protein
MNKGGKIGLVVVLFVLLGVGGYYGYKMLYKPKEEEDEDIVIIPPTNSGDGSGSGSGATNYTFPFKTTDEGNTFRAWINTKYPAYAKEIKLDPTGSLNKYVETAWLKYGTEYTKKGSGSGSGVVATASEIGQIQAFADKNDKTTTSYLKGTNQEFVKKWAKSIKDGKSAFVWANQVYRVKTGARVLDYNPLTTTFYANKSADALKSTPSKSASASAVTKNQNLGKGGGVAFADGYLYIYLKDKEKWIASIWVGQYKVAFTGETEFEQFNGFTNDEE